MVLLFRATPGLSYQILRSPDLKVWTRLDTGTAAADGTLPHLDPAPPPGTAFYLLAVP